MIIIEKSATKKRPQKFVLSVTFNQRWNTILMQEPHTNKRAREQGDRIVSNSANIAASDAAVAKIATDANAACNRHMEGQTLRQIDY